MESSDSIIAEIKKRSRSFFSPSTNFLPLIHRLANAIIYEMNADLKPQILADILRFDNYPLFGVFAVVWAFNPNHYYWEISRYMQISIKVVEYDPLQKVSTVICRDWVSRYFTELQRKKIKNQQERTMANKPDISHVSFSHNAGPQQYRETQRDALQHSAIKERTLQCGEPKPAEIKRAESPTPEELETKRKQQELENEKQRIRKFTDSVVGSILAQAKEDAAEILEKTRMAEQEKTATCRHIFDDTMEEAISAGKTFNAHFAVPEAAEALRSELDLVVKEQMEASIRMITASLCQCRQSAEQAVSESGKALECTLGKIKGQLDEQKTTPLKDCYRMLIEITKSLNAEEPDPRPQLQHIHRDLLRLLREMENTLGAFGVKLYVPEPGTPYDEDLQAPIDIDMDIPDGAVVSHCICPGFMDQNGDILEDGRRRASVSLVSKSVFESEESRK